jgi:hypothetical protein
MSTQLQRRTLQLRKPVPPGAPSAPPSTPPAAAAARPAAASEPEPVTDHALRFLRARAAQLERQVSLACAEVRSRDALVADAVAALDGVRELAHAAAGARSPEEAQPALRQLDAFARSTLAKCLERGCALGGDEEPRWLVPFTPAAGNRFLTPAPAAGAWDSGASVTVAGAASGEARALVQGARVAALEEMLVSLAPALAQLAQQRGCDDALAAQVDAAARQLAELAALSPTRGFLFGSPAAQPRSGAARPAPPKKPAALRAPAPAAAAAPGAKPSRPAAAPGRLPDLAGALASMPPFAPGRESDGRDAVAHLLRDAAAAEAAWAAERQAMRAELDSARAARTAAHAPPALAAAAAPLRRVLDAGAAVERAPSEATLKALVAAMVSERAVLDAALHALS